MGNVTLQRVQRYPLFKFASSLKLGVSSMLSLASVLATATVLESIYGTRAVYLMVYGTWWFYGLLTCIFVNVLCAALSRYPWKKRQTGFVITHLGILTILFGSYLTMQFGVDGNLPVAEGESDGKVILNGLMLNVGDEGQNRTESFSIPEAPLAKKGNLMEVAFASGDKLVVTEWIPRASLQQKYIASPLEGVGSPSIHVEIANSRFQVDEWLADGYPGKGNELNLGPATLKFRKLWTAEEERAFSASAKKSATKDSSVGYVILDFGGKTYRLTVESLSSWKRLGSEDLEVKVSQYLPYAIVKEGKLISKNNEPVNPAVEVLVRNSAGLEEKHSVFAVFPEFSTMHKNHRKDGRAFGVKLRLVSSAAKGAATTGGDERGRLELAQSVDDKRLLYRVFARSGETNSSGEVKLGVEVATGWMDLKFKVTEWLPHSISQVRPYYVEEVRGTDNNFLSSLYVQPRPAKVLASGAETPGFWLTEGENRNVSLGGRKILLSLGRHSMTLPFEIFLEKFTIGNDPGTTKAATYESLVKVKDAARGDNKAVLISMNEPMHHGGYTFYQASYQLREGQPPVSVFSVNFDPGRWLKYLGSLIMCSGIGLMFWLNPHYWDLLLGSRKE